MPEETKFDPVAMGAQPVKKVGDFDPTLMGATPVQAAPAPEAPPDAVAQSRALLASKVQPGFLGGAYPSKPEEQTIQNALPQVPGRVAAIRKEALTAGGGAFGGAAVKGAGFIPAILRSLGSGAGAITGNVTGQVASGGEVSPTETLKAGATYTGGQLIGESVAPIAKWLSSSKSAGAKLLQQASTKAGQAPVELSPETNQIVDEIVQQSRLGGKPVKVITDLLDRLGPTTRHAADANPGPLTYDEARILQGNAGELSAQEAMDLKGRLKYLIPQFAKSFGKDVQAAADAAGIGPEHALGMREYANASARNRALIKAGKYTAAGAGIYGAAHEAKSLIDAVKGKR